MPSVSIIWALVVLYLLWRLEVLYKDWLKKQQSLSDKQLEDLTKKLADLQGQINSLAIQKDYE